MSLQIILDKYITQNIPTRNIELEIRMGYFRGINFNSSIKGYTYNTLLKNLSADKNFNMTRYFQIITYYTNGNKKIENEQTKQIEYLNKKNIHIIDLYNEGLRIALSEENILPVINNENIKLIKNRIRTSFTDFNKKYRIDITEDHIGTRIIYQYEIEFLKKPTINELNHMIDYFKKIRTTLEFEQNIVSQFNRFFTNKTYIGTPVTLGKKPIDLKLENILYLEDYIVHNKLNGIGASIMFINTGIFMIYPTEIVQISNTCPAKLTNTIIQGEYMNKYKKFYAYDLFFYKGENERNINYNLRYDLLKIIQKKSKPIFLFDIVKIFKIQEIDKIFKYIETNFKPQDNDGLIFVPLVSKNVYYKWKPQNELTIDFSAKPTKIKNIYNLYVMGDSSLIKFNDAKSEITPEKIKELVNINSSILPDFYIIEYKYNDNKKLFEPVRLRNDKIIPNYKKVADDTYELIQNPISNIILQKSMQFVLLKTDNINTIFNKICHFFKLTKNPSFFLNLSDYLPKNYYDLFIKIYKEVVKENQNKNDYINILNDYFFP